MNEFYDRSLLPSPPQTQPEQRYRNVPLGAEPSQPKRGLGYVQDNSPKPTASAVTDPLSVIPDPAKLRGPSVQSLAELRLRARQECRGETVTGPKSEDSWIIRGASRQRLEEQRRRERDIMRQRERQEWKWKLSRQQEMGRLVQAQQNNQGEAPSHRQQAVASHTGARRQQARNARQESDSPRTRYEVLVKCVILINSDMLKSFAKLGAAVCQRKLVFLTRGQSQKRQI